METMSWECKYKSGDTCHRLDLSCDPGRTGCVLHGRFYFPFAPEKNSRAINEAVAEHQAADEDDSQDLPSDTANS
jgi:hypothetical protein